MFSAQALAHSKHKSGVTKDKFDKGQSKSPNIIKGYKIREIYS